MSAYAWVQRNEDKPHRCPECHGVADRARADRYGPRTRMRCPAACGVQWRAGVRVYPYRIERYR